MEDLHRSRQLCHSLPYCSRGPAGDWAPRDRIPLPLHSWGWRLRPRRLTQQSLVDVFLKGLAGPVPPAPAVNLPPCAACVPHERVFVCVLCYVQMCPDEFLRCLIFDCKWVLRRVDLTVMRDSQKVCKCVIVPILRNSSLHLFQ